MSKGAKIQFDEKQVTYLVHKTGCNDPHEAVECFAKIIKELHIDPFKMHVYLKRLMDKDGV